MMKNNNAQSSNMLPAKPLDIVIPLVYRVGTVLSLYHIQGCIHVLLARHISARPGVGGQSETTLCGWLHQESCIAADPAPDNVVIPYAAISRNPCCQRTAAGKE